MTTRQIRSTDEIRDELTGANRSVGELRHLLHAGKIFVATETYTSLLDAEYFNVLLTTGPDEDTAPHVLDLVAMVDKRDCIMSLYVNPTIGAKPNSEQSFNLNFQSDKTAKSHVWTQPEVLAVGNLLAVIPLPDKYEPSYSPELNTVLPPNTDFLVRIYIHKKQTIRFVLRWYEQQYDQDTITT